MNAPEPIPFDETANWPDPDLTLCKPERPSAPVMSGKDFDLVFGPWADWLRNAAEAKGAPVDYVALALLSVASAVVGNLRWAMPWEGWKEPLVLWAMLVGDPSSGKSPALDAIMDVVKEIERELIEAYKVARRDWDARAEIAALAQDQWKKDARKAMAEGESAPPKPEAATMDAQPIRERISISDATTEKVAELLVSSWRGLLLMRDELSGWLTSMDRYNGGGDRPFWLEAFGGRSYTVDRKNSPEPIIVDRFSVAVLGGTQPDKLASLLAKTDDDGLLARFLTVFPEPIPLSRPGVQLDNDKLKTAFELLKGLPPAKDEYGNPHPVYLTFTNAAAEALQDFRAQCRDREVEACGLFKGYIGKLPGLAVRVACVLALLDWTVEPGQACPNQIEDTHLGRACHLVGEHLSQHAFRAYGAAEVPLEIRNARRLAGTILKDRPRYLTIREIQRREIGGLQTAKQIEAAFGVLEQADWVRRERQASGGRPRTKFHVNPKLWRRNESLA